MLRTGLGLLLLLLAGCSGRAGLLPHQPGLDVARAALSGGSPQVALQVTYDVLAKHPGDEAALIVQGDALTALGRYDQATEDYTKVLKRNPRSVDAHVGLGRLRLATNPAGAEALFLEALQEDARNAVALNDLGIARDLQGHHEAAQQAYGKALGIEPDMHAAEVNLALSLAMTGDQGRAMKLLQPLASEPGASRKLRHDLAAVLAMGGHQEEAERILSADLTPQQIQQALADYVAARTGEPPPLPPAMPEAAMPAAPAGAPPPIRLAPPPAGPAPLHAAAHPGAQVQFTAAPSEDAAQAAWQRMKERMPKLLAGQEPMFIKVTRGNQTFWRLRTDGFASAADASRFCARVRAAGGACMVYDEQDQPRR